MSDSNTIAKPRGIIGYDPTLDDELFAFQRAAYPERDPELVEPRWRWMFLDSAARLGVDPMVWLYRAKSGIVGHQGAIAVRLKVDDQEFATGWFVETMVLESHRGKALGPMLIKKALEDLPLNLSLGQTEQMREIQFALGWQHVAPLEMYMHVLNLRRVLAGKTRGAFSRMFASAALRATQRLRGSRRLLRADRNVETVPINRFDEQHDALWQRASCDVRCAVIRDASYLNWKYVDQPGQDFIRLEIRKNGEIAAVVVLQIREPDEHYHYRRAFIVDLVAPLSKSDVIAAALSAARREAKSRNADALIFPILNDRLQRHLFGCGFLRRQPTRHFLVATGEPSLSITRLPLTPDAWLVTMGDSDIDRPW